MLTVKETLQRIKERKERQAEIKQAEAERRIEAARMLHGLGFPITGVTAGWKK